MACSNNINADEALPSSIQNPQPPIQTPQDAWLKFIYYNTNTSPANSLYSLLIAPAQAKNRAGMEGLALQFLQNEAPFTNQYYYNLLNVPPPFATFIELYYLLMAVKDVDKYKDTITQEFGFKDGDGIMDFMATAWKDVIEQVWQNYFALTIMAGFNELFIEQLNKILLVLNFIEKLFAVPPSPVPGTKAAFNLLLQAVIVLPGVPAGQKEPIFPLPPYPPM